MKKLLHFFVALLFVFELYGQTPQPSADTNWVQLMSTPNANFYAIQNAFNNYWEGKTIPKGKGYKQFRRWEEYMSPRVYPSGNINLPSQTWTNYQQWLQQQGNNPAPKSLTSNWTPIGPYGSTGSSGGGCGRINFIRFDPTNTNIMYVGTPDGGLWRSTDAGESWTPLTDQLTVIGCSDLAIDPNNSQNMYMATGDGDAWDSNSIGVLRSTDGGLTWNPTGLVWNVSQGIHISRLVMHPTNSQILIMATSNGIYRTTNGGTTWTQTSGGSFKDLELQPGNPSVVYASGTIFRKSSDGGATWTTISSGLPASGISRIGIAVTPSNPALVYLLIGNNASGLLGVYLSSNSGTSFTQQRGSSPNMMGYAADGSDGGGQAWYDLAIAASPAAAGTVVLGGVNTWKSTNHGLNWNLNSHWYGDAGAPYVHADVHAIEYLPGSVNTYFIGCDGGLFKTTDGGLSFEDISNDLNISQQYRIGLSSTMEERLITGHQDNGSNMYNAGVWSNVRGGDGMDCLIDRTNNNIVYASYVYSTLYRSNDGGTNWATITSGLPNGGSSGASWLTAFHQDPVTATTLYAGGHAAMYKSTNSGTNWSQIGTPSGSGNIVEFVIAPSNNQVIYSVKDNAISKSTNGGTNWTNISSGLPTGVVSFTNVTVSNIDENDIWITCSGYSGANKVFKSTNGGSSWANISNGLPNVPCNTIVYQNGSVDEVVYVGTDIGVFFIDNTASSWTSFMNGLPRVSVRDLEIFYPESKLRAGTYGRGTWESNLAEEVAATPVADFSANKTTVCAGQSVTFTDESGYDPTSWNWNFTGGTPSSSTDQNPVITYNTPGTYEVTLTATNALGSDSETKTGYITVIGVSGAALPLSEGFTSATFPPAGWSIVNGNGSPTWHRTTAAGAAPTTGNAMAFQNYGNDDSDDDEVRIKALNFSGISTAQLTFDVAYAPYIYYEDGLEVLISTDCGGTFTSVYSKSGTTLATAPATSSLFTPTASQWRNEVIDLTAFVGNSKVIVAFKNLSGYSNRIFVDNINITGTNSSVTANFSASSATVCTGQNVTLTDASTGATSWSWDFGSGATPATATGVGPHSVSYSSAGSKTITLTVNGSVTTTQTVTVNATPTATITAGGATTFCTGGSVVLNANTGSGLTYQWKLNGTNIGGATSASYTANAAGTYTVVVTNGSGCSTTSSATTVTVNASPASTITAGGATTFCTGGSVVLNANTGSGLTYQWKLNGTNIGGATSASYTANAAGTYTVVVTNGSGCSTTSSATTVTVNPTPSAPTISAGGATTFCQGGSVTLTSSAGSGNTWSTGATTPSITVSTSGTYSVTTTASGCTSPSSSATTVTVNPIPAAPTISAGGVTTFCQGGSVTLTSSAGSGNTWSTGATTPSITVSTSGTYSVTTTASGCTSPSSSATTVTVNPIPSAPTISAGGATTFCQGGSVTLTSSAGSGNTWSTGATTPSITVSTSGTYSVTTTASGCTSPSSASTTVTVNPTPSLTTGTLSNPSSCGQTDGSIQVTGSGTGNISWSGTSSGSLANVSLPVTIPSLGAGSYTINFTSAEGCPSNTLNTSLSDPGAPSAPTISAGGPVSFCQGGSVTLTSTAATGNVWSTGATTQSITVSSSGTYTVTQTVGTCTSGSSNAITVDVNAPITPSFNAIPAFCAGSTAPVLSTTSTNGIPGTWNPAVVSNTASGTYTFTPSAGQCATTATASVTVNALPNVSFGSVPQLCVYNSPITLTQGAPSGGTYSGTGVSGAQFDPSVAGVGTIPLTYAYTDGNGCSASAQSSVVVDGCVGISEESVDLLSVYPNPSTGTVTIDAGSLSIQNIEVFNHMGQLVLTISGTNDTKQEVQLNTVANGVYTIRITTQQYVHNTSIVIER